MAELTREIFVGLWKDAKAGSVSAVADEAILQKYMLMHEDMHPHFERLASDPAASADVEGENLILHIAMDAAAERALESDQPPGVRMLMQQMLDSQFDPGVAFHVLSQALMHETIVSADAGGELDLQKFLHRAAAYAEQVQANRPAAE